MLRTVAYLGFLGKARGARAPLPLLALARDDLRIDDHAVLIRLATRASPDCVQDLTQSDEDFAAMQVVPRTHITAVAGNALTAMQRFMPPLRALIAAGLATGDVRVAGSNAPRVPSDSVLVIDASLVRAPFVAQAAASGCRIVCDFDRLAGDRLASPSALARFAVAAVTAANEPLAAALRVRGYAPTVTPTVLDRQDWPVQPPRAPHRRPRVGVYARSAELSAFAPPLGALIGAFGSAVAFVFFDALPDALAQALTEPIERVMPVPLALFAVTFAACDLDLVLIPRAPANASDQADDIALLQAGMLGYPVIASDVAPRRALPVRWVANDAAHWIAAVREALADPSAARAAGERLRAAVHADWLAPRRLDTYFAAWTGSERMARNA